MDFQIGKISEIDEVSIDIVIKKKADILNDIDFESDDDRILCDTIITDIEKTAAKGVLADKIVQLPFLGSMRKSPLRKVVQKNRTNFKIARTHMNKKEYQEYVGEIMREGKIEIEKEEKEKIRIKKIKSRFRKQYDSYYKNLGAEYANMFIYSMSILKEVPFNAEVQEMFDSLKD